MPPRDVISDSQTSKWTKKQLLIKEDFQSLFWHVTKFAMPLHCQFFSKVCDNPCNMYRFTTISSAFITASAPLITFMIPSSTWNSYPRSSSCPIDSKFFFKPFTCHTFGIMWITPSSIFTLIEPTPTISKAWSLPM